MTFAHLDGLRMHSGKFMKWPMWMNRWRVWFSCYKCTHSLSLYLVLEHCACTCKPFGVLEQHGLLMSQSKSWCGWSDLQISAREIEAQQSFFYEIVTKSKFQQLMCTLCVGLVQEISSKLTWNCHCIWTKLASEERGSDKNSECCDDLQRIFTSCENMHI
jgi:hypothetical protein